MANTKSAEKRHRQAEKRRASNKAAKSRLKSSLKTARAGVAGTKGDAAKDIVTGGYSDIDKAAKKGVIKKNTANRYKSRLAKASKAAAQ
ncbi:MAG: 30S ribosomal protein S20 [Acidobacteria bacterium]|nr:30S ribosomal protein S20 [Acidobacteriota bacterium]